MCGRFTMTLDPAQLREAFPGLFVPDEYFPRFNIAPSQPVAVIPNTGEYKLFFYKWGLIPSWAKDPSVGYRMINARAETLSEKPTFRTIFKRRRCLILVDGFFEWKSDPSIKSKQPYYIHLQSKKVFAFAGLWDIWFHPDGSEIRTCTIITTSPNELITPIHNRMPVILPDEEYHIWLDDKEQDPGKLAPLLKPYPSVEMSAYPVSRTVNSPNVDSLECIKPISS